MDEEIYRIIGLLLFVGIVVTATMRMLGMV
jgi:hypothetical protein